MSKPLKQLASVSIKAIKRPMDESSPHVNFFTVECNGLDKLKVDHFDMGISVEL